VRRGAPQGGNAVGGAGVAVAGRRDEHAPATGRQFELDVRVRPVHEESDVVDADVSDPGERRTGPPAHAGGPRRADGDDRGNGNQGDRGNRNQGDRGNGNQGGNGNGRGKK